MPTYGVWFKSKATGTVRNTPVNVEANSRSEAIKKARPRVRRPSDPVVASARVLTGQAKKDSDAGRWVRERADGSRPAKAGNKRGFGPSVQASKKAVSKRKR